MTQREKIAHLLRRFGLGASFKELDACEKRGIEGTLEWLIEYEKAEENFPISPWEFCFEKDDQSVRFEPQRIAAWWTLRLCFTERPLQEKLTLFWHNHFAVNASKIQLGPLMAIYLDNLRKNAAGSFHDLLEGISKDPAMIRWLDTDSNTKDAPNENFAREVMELFTLGRGNYTEKDIQEAARAFSGWGVRYLVLDGGFDRIQGALRESMAAGKPLAAFCISPSLHDNGSKTVLGQTANFSGEEVLKLLALRPETAKHITKKLWEFFAYPNPEPQVVERLSKVFLQNGSQIKPVLYAIARSPEFWSDKCVRKLVKSPVDFLVPLLRQVDARSFLLPLRDSEATPVTAIAKPLFDLSTYLWALMNRQGMMLLFPPDVSGWKWGSAWISSASMMERMALGEVFFGSQREAKDMAKGVGTLVALRKPYKSPEEFITGLLELFDAQVPSKVQKELVHCCQNYGGIEAFQDGKKASILMGRLGQLLFASPDFQMF